MQDDVERVARAIASAAGLDWDGKAKNTEYANHGYWLPLARAAMAATREIDAEALRELAEKILPRLIPMEVEWLTGWQGVGGAAFNAIGEGMAERGLTVSYTDWSLSPLGDEVVALARAAQIERKSDEG